MKKWILRIVLGVIALVIVAFVILFFMLNTLVKSGVTYGGNYATGQDTTLDAADLSLFGGTLQLNNLGIKNLKDYSAPNILQMGKASITMQPASIFTHTVVIDQISLDGLEISLEQNGMKNNLNDLMAQIQKNTAAATPPPNDAGAPAGAAPSSPPAPTPPGKELKITQLIITGAVVHIRANPINMDLKLPTLMINDPTNPDGRPMKIADLIGTVLLQLTKQILESPQLPGNIKDAMKDATAIVNNVKGQLDKNVKVMSKELQDLTKNPMNAIQGAASNPMKGLQDMSKDPLKGLQSTTQGFGGLLNPNKK